MSERLKTIRMSSLGTRRSKRLNSIPAFKWFLAGSIFSNYARVSDLVDADLRLIDKYRSARKEELSAKSMHNEGQLLKQFFGRCAEPQLIESNPLAARKFRPPKYEPREGPTLDQME
jgi:hypothetical protein